MIAYGVKLKGAAGFSLFLQSNKYSFCVGWNLVSTSSGAEELASRAISCESHPAC